MRNVYQFIWIMPPLMKNQRAAFLKLSGNDCELLCSTDRTVSEIALEVGFSGGSYFAEVFRKGFGQSPTEFRKRERDSV